MTDLLALIDAEIANLQQARVLITANGKKRPGRQKSVAVSKDKYRKKRKMSPETRAKISAKAKERWAAIQKAAK